MNNLLIVILGITGDLAKRKLLPALVTLLHEKKIGKFAVVGVARDAIAPADLIAESQKYSDCSVQAAWDLLAAHLYYESVDFAHVQDFAKVAKTITELEQKYELPGNRLVYFATASQFFCPITKALIDYGIVESTAVLQPRKVWHRVVYEKPFGYDVPSAHEINECIAIGFEESQVFRIDHYLAKEVVGNIALMRFTNRIFEPLWNNQNIDNIQIILSEEVGVVGRGGYYDQYGACKDVMQNHMLQLLALIAMEAPRKLTGDYIRDEKARVLECTRPVDGLLGQYVGYRDEKGVAPQSATETFAVMQFEVDNARWRGVPFYLKTGKCLGKKETVICITFKMVDCLLSKACPSEPNSLTMQLYPNAASSLKVNIKKPGVQDDVVPVAMAFSSNLFGPGSLAAYEVLFEEVMKGDQSISVRYDEIEYAWRVMQKVKALNVPLYTYQVGSNGPHEQEVYAQEHKFRWCI